MWLGYGFEGRMEMLYDVPKGYARDVVANAMKGESYYRQSRPDWSKDGSEMSAWFTNFDHKPSATRN